ncbi:hypothetical protein D3C71_1983190 [compost metagenome]
MDPAGAVDHDLRVAERARGKAVLLAGRAASSLGLRDDTKGENAVEIACTFDEGPDRRQLLPDDPHAACRDAGIAGVAEDGLAVHRRSTRL